MFFGRLHAHMHCTLDRAREREETHSRFEPLVMRPAPRVAHLQIGFAVMLRMRCDAVSRPRPEASGNSVRLTESGPSSGWGLGTDPWVRLLRSTQGPGAHTEALQDVHVRMCCITQRYGANDQLCLRDLKTCPRGCPNAKGATSVLERELQIVVRSVLQALKALRY